MDDVRGKYELIKNRITNIESSVHEQRLLQMQVPSMQTVSNVYGNAIQGFGMFLHQTYVGAQSHLLHISTWIPCDT